MNLIKLAGILRDSWVWIPCNAIMTEADYDNLEKMVQGAAERGDLDSLVGQEIMNQDVVRMVPDILQGGEDFYFPVFTSVDEMGEYGNAFSKIQRHFLVAANLAENNKKDIRGIVINAFTEPFVVPRELFAAIAKLDSSFDKEEGKSYEQECIE